VAAVVAANTASERKEVSCILSEQK
jgi:hypothetical protein